MEIKTKFDIGDDVEVFDKVLREGLITEIYIEVKENELKEQELMIGYTVHFYPHLTSEWSYRENRLRLLRKREGV
jgi:hypothetical protein